MLLNRPVMFVHPGRKTGGRVGFDPLTTASCYSDLWPRPHGGTSPSVKSSRWPGLYQPAVRPDSALCRPLNETCMGRMEARFLTTVNSAQTKETENTAQHTAAIQLCAAAQTQHLQQTDRHYQLAELQPYLSWQILAFNQIRHQTGSFCTDMMDIPSVSFIHLGWY